MSEVDCARCGSTAAGLDRPPLPGDLGRRVLERTCRPCWDEWLRAQVILINERRLNPAKAEDFEALLVAMTAFLNLGQD
jgi:Fe-S cluster biosynthesis and repair protein YggX